MNKYSKKFIALNTFSISFWLCLVVILNYFGGMIEDDNGEKLFSFSVTSLVIVIIILVGIIALSLLYSVLFYRTHYYTFGDNDITLRTGVIFKKTLVLPYEKINNIKTNKTLFDMLFGLVSLKIDSGSSVQGVTEIKIIDTYDKVREYENYVRQKIGLELKEETITQYKYGLKQNYGYSLLRYGFVYGFLAMIYIYFMFFMDVLTGEDTMEDLTFVIGFGLLVFAIVCIATLIINRIRFYKFSATKQNNIITLSYGLFEQKNITITTDRIRSIKICQSLLQRILGTATIKLDVIGLEVNNDKQYEKSILLPYIKMSELDGYFKYFFEEWDLTEKEVIRPSEKSYFYYWGLPALIFNVFFFTIILGFIVTMDDEIDAMLIAPVLFTVMNLIIFVLTLCSHKLQRLGYNDNYIMVTKGSLSKDKVIINKKDITVVTRQTTPIRQKIGLCSYGINYYSQSADMLKVSVTTDTEFEKIVDITRIKKEG